MVFIHQQTCIFHPITQKHIRQKHNFRQNNRQNKKRQSNTKNSPVVPESSNYRGTPVCVWVSPWCVYHSWGRASLSQSFKAANNASQRRSFQKFALWSKMAASPSTFAALSLLWPHGKVGALAMPCTRRRQHSCAVLTLAHQALHTNVFSRAC